MRVIGLLGLICAFSAVGCTIVLPLEQLSVPLDGDARLADASQPGDAGAPDGSLADAMQPGDAGPPDGPLVETIQPDDTGLLADATQPVDVVLSDGLLACLVDSDCQLANNCCECNAYPAGKVPMCPLPCTNQTCVDSYQMTAPAAICVLGRCVVADAIYCAADAKCQLVNDCCRCMVFAANLPAPYCPISTCFTDTCSSLGLGSAQATCVGNHCRLVP